MVVFGSFKTVERVLRKPYGLPKHFGFLQLPQGLERGQHPADDAQQRDRTRHRRVRQHRPRLCLAAYGLARFGSPGRIGAAIGCSSAGWSCRSSSSSCRSSSCSGRSTCSAVLWSLVIVYCVFGIPLGVLVMTGFFAALPRDLEDAARIDGASHFEIFWRIMLPLTRPALSAVVILNGVWMWNDFFLGFILITRQNAMTLPVGIMAFRGTYSTEWGLIFASVTISVMPVVTAYLLLSRQFIAGLTAGSVKGKWD